MNRALNYLRLRRHRNPGDNVKFGAGGEFRLVPVVSFCGVANVVRKDSFLSQVHFGRFVPEPSDDFSICMYWWKTEQFYVTRFYALVSSAFRSEN